MPTAVEEPTSASSGAPPIEFTNEVRYAVVMYGGVSLCIYINGVAQELLELARATAPDPRNETQALTATEALSESAKIYRRLGQYLDSDDFPSARLRQSSDASIRTRFVVDVLSGTSAGGLNSIFLAKALANNQDMNGLKQLWMKEGDLAKLLNDQGSKLPDLPVKGEPQSLLNSRRMYDKLLTALHEMDFPKETKAQGGELEAAQHGAPPTLLSLVEELDLYVTATDLRGLPIHIQLDNGVANELRHRSVFRFRCGRLGSDFGPRNNPLLAFAGRCTSSIPPAFEPMRLEDIAPVLRTWPRYREMITAGPAEWARFHSDYQPKETGDFWKRDFGDGGFLDNKPFSYATGALMRRQAERPVARKLLYIEPNPVPLDADTTSEQIKPNALQHSMAALLSLPRYETIREDLEAVLDRNRLLERIDEITREVDRDVERKLNEKPPETMPRDQAALKYASTPLRALIEERGICYGIYHRLKVADVTSDLAALVSDLLGYAASSDECVAVRKLMLAWRSRWFEEDPSWEAIAADRWPKTETRFLLDFDPNYRLRRLYFLHRKITWFYRFAPQSVEAAERAEQMAAGRPDPLPPDVAALLDDVANPARWRRFRQALLEIKAALAKVVLELRLVGREVRGDAELVQMLREALPPEEVARYLREPGTISAAAMDAVREETWTAISSRIAEHYIAVFKRTSEMSAAALSPDVPVANDEERIARQALWRIHTEFDLYDMAIFPVQYGSGSGETPHVEILRVSPGDATNLSENQEGRRKLAGTEFFSFGAFFAEFWRENDMLWGRLDGAEVLVRNLLAHTPAASQRAAGDPAFGNHPSLRTEGDRQRKTVADLVLDDLHTAILRDHLGPVQRAHVWDLLQRTLPHVDRKDLPEEISRFFDDSTQLGRVMRHLIDFCQDDEQLLSYYKETYAVQRQLDRGQLLKIVSRATKIFGRMVQDIAGQRTGPGKELPALLLRSAAVFSGIVELSLPRSAGELLWRYWRTLLYVMGGLLFAAGFVFNAPGVEKGGVLILAVTAAVHLATSWLELWITRRCPWISRVVAVLLSLLFGAIFLLGAWRAYELSRPLAQWVSERLSGHDTGGVQPPK